MDFKWLQKPSTGAHLFVQPSVHLWFFWALLPVSSFQESNMTAVWQIPWLTRLSCGWLAGTTFTGKNSGCYRLAGNSLRPANFTSPYFHEKYLRSWWTHERLHLHVFICLLNWFELASTQVSIDIAISEFTMIVKHRNLCVAGIYIVTIVATPMLQPKLVLVPHMQLIVCSN